MHIPFRIITKKPIDVLQKKIATIKKDVNNITRLTLRFDDKLRIHFQIA